MQIAEARFNGRTQPSRAQIFAEDARFNINVTTNTLNVEQGVNNKFPYSVNWFNDDFANELSCVNDLFKQKIFNKLIEQARISINHYNSGHLN